MVPSYGNTCGYIYGSPGGAKSAIVNGIKGLLPSHSVSSLEDNLLQKSGSVKNTLVKGKAFVAMNDVTNKSFTQISVAFVKKFSGRDLQATDIKYKDAINFNSEG